MKFIAKGTEPESLTRWRLENKKTPQNLRYKNMPKAGVRDALLAEQGHLCAYTLWRISTPNKGHIEHIRSQKSAREARERGETDDSDFDYANMVYCYPGEDITRCEFGAHQKDHAPVSPDTFVSPLEATCQERFRFEDNGGIIPARNSDAAAAATIDLLCLNAERLKKARGAAIRALPIFKPSARLSAKEARKRARLALEREADGAFPEFAVAIHQVLSRYADKRAAKEAGFAKGYRG